MVNVAALVETFKRRYGNRPRIFSAPGRVNLIGEHTDYNEGFVLPIAIDRRTFVAAAANGTSDVRIDSQDLQEGATFSLRHTDVQFENKWTAYVGGVALELQAAGLELCGADLAISSDVPIGAGLSSSAALEIAVATALISINGQAAAPTTIALAAQNAEHKYVGTKCGVMDQLAVTLGQRNHALLIDCRSLGISQILLNLPDAILVVCDTNVKHDLAASAYNQRRRECEQAVDFFRQYLPAIRSLRDLDPVTFEMYDRSLPDVLRRRTRHVVTENARTVAAADALAQGNLDHVGRLMYDSHKSLRDDYQVSAPELDLLIDLAQSFPGVIGARMTGGGFGGCTINLLRRDAFSGFSEFVKTRYRAASGIEAAIYSVNADDGVKEVVL